MVDEDDTCHTLEHVKHRSRHCYNICLNVPFIMFEPTHFHFYCFEYISNVESCMYWVHAALGNPIILNIWMNLIGTWIKTRVAIFHGIILTTIEVSLNPLVWWYTYSKFSVVAYKTNICFCVYLGQGGLKCIRNDCVWFTYNVYQTWVVKSTLHWGHLMNIPLLM